MLAAKRRVAAAFTLIDRDAHCENMLLISLIILG